MLSTRLDLARLKGVALGDAAATDQAADDELLVRRELEYADALPLAGALASLAGASDGDAMRRRVDALGQLFEQRRRECLSTAVAAMQR